MAESGLRFAARALLLEECPHITVDHVGAVDAGQDADDDGQRKLADGGDAQNAQRNDGDQGGDGGADGTAQAFLDGDVGDLFLRVMEMLVTSSFGAVGIFLAFSRIRSKITMVLLME